MAKPRFSRCPPTSSSCTYRWSIARATSPHAAACRVTTSGIRRAKRLARESSITCPSIQAFYESWFCRSKVSANRPCDITRRCNGPCRRYSYRWSRASRAPARPLIAVTLCGRIVRMTNDSQTPLSDLMAAFASSGSPESFARFLAAFRGSKVGVVAVGAAPGSSGDVTSTAAQPISVGLSGHGDGQPRVLAFADPVVFARRFGQPFNADMTGEALMKTAMHNPRCAGILVNSAVSESSVRIDRATMASLINSPGPQDTPMRRRPWWRFW